MNINGIKEWNCVFSLHMSSHAVDVRMTRYCKREFLMLQSQVMAYCGGFMLLSLGFYL